MNDFKASPAPLPASPRVLLLSGSELLEGTMRQHLHQISDCQMQRCTQPRPDQLRCDLVLLDPTSYTRDDAVRLLRRAEQAPLALVNALPEQAEALVEAHPWIRGVFYRGSSGQTFGQGFGRLLDGGDWLPRGLTERLVSRYRQLTPTSQGIDQLTVREKQILALAGKGLSNAEIARTLHLSTHTIKSHVHNALRKLGASNRAQGAAMVLAYVYEPSA
ncbi:helix-turn-helix transcriptional regulator [Pseudomonas oligotrophica]|uniref:helix-turn-helix transcriptional regulator n=1 Tax=Pseudomonas oligotrophica TaxID=2912055 RepID=UPI001F33ECAD|nr:response regulator transcription factor [Pseudomonas oligotrophica]MCF7201986.1 response regulator transcription factor [Pseudomonas oligotrophica]